MAKGKAHTVVPGQGQITSFYRPKKKRGRPPKNKRNNRASNPNNTIPPRDTTTPTHAKETTVEVNKRKDAPSESNDIALPLQKKARVNWSIDPHFQGLVKDWLNNGPSKKDPNGEEITSLTQYSSIHNIPFHTLYKYCREDGSKRLELGGSVGRKPLIPKIDQTFVVETAVRKDRANDGLSPKEMYGLIIDICPGKELTVKQARDHFERTMKTGHKHLLKQNFRVAQATTTKRNAMSIEQQWRWHALIDYQLKKLRELNTGLCGCKCGKTFGELIDHFVLGGDETCFMASRHGQLRVVAAKGKKKHEKNSEDCRQSITVYRSFTSAGNDGPSVFLTQGKTAANNGGFTDAFLKRFGAAEGSTLVPTPSAYTDTNTWEKITQSLIKGYRASSEHVKKSPHWWMLEIVDGFGAHLASVEALKQRSDAKIFCIKEEADTSSYNQAYDQFVGKSDKAHHEEAVVALQGSRYANGVLNQWSLVHAALFAIRQTKKETRINSFQRVNLQPSTRTNFKTWIEKKDQALQAGTTFDHAIDADKFDMLPFWWQALHSSKKKNAMLIVKNHNGFTVDCLKELDSSCTIDLSMAQDFRLCYECALENPSHLDRDASTSCNHNVIVTQAPSAPTNIDTIPPTQEDFVALEANVQTNVLNGLANFQLKPPGLSGLQLFGHMIKFRELHKAAKECFCTFTTEPSQYLDVEVSHANRCVCAATANELCGTCLDTKRNIMADSFGTNAKARLARRKLNATAGFKSQCAVLNSEEALRRHENFQKMTAAIAELDATKAEKKNVAKEDLKKTLMDASVAALTKLIAKKGKVSDLKKNEMSAILLKCYGHMMDPVKHKVGPLVSALNSKISGNRNALGVDAAAADFSKFEGNM